MTTVRDDNKCSVPLAMEQVPLLGKLHAAEREALGKVFQLQRVPRGRLVVREGDSDRSLYFISSGKVKASHGDQQGKEVILALLGPGEYFGEIALLAETPRTNDIVALTSCVFLVLRQTDFLEHIRHHHGLSLLLLQTLALRLRAMSLKFADLALLDVCSRLARALLSLSEMGEHEGEDVPVVRERPTHQELASMVGTSREAVTRALKALEEDGHLVVERERVVILSLPRV